MRVTEEDFRPRLGRIGGAHDQGASPRAPWTPRAGSKIRGRAAAIAARLAPRQRQVVVRARASAHAATAQRTLSRHIGYLEREGVGRDGREGRLFDAAGEADAEAFARRVAQAPHHFRLVVSPEDGADLADLPGFARDLMRQAERDLSTRLDWAGVEHWNTAQPHLHLLVSGRDDRGGELFISRDYLAEGLRARAEALAGLELGPRTAREVAVRLERQIGAERWTRLDELLGAAAVDGWVNPTSPQLDHVVHGPAAARLEKLAELELATDVGGGVWRLSADHEARLHELARQASSPPWTRAARPERSLEAPTPHLQLVGRLASGVTMEDGLETGEVVLEAVDGTAHRLTVTDFGDLFGASSDVLIQARMETKGGVASLRRLGDAGLERQIRAPGPTWLDAQLVSDAPLALSEKGLGAEVRAALAARRDHLSALRLAPRRGDDGEVALGPAAALRIQPPGASPSHSRGISL